MNIGRSYDDLVSVLMRVNGRTREEATRSIERMCSAGLLTKQADGLYYRTALGEAFTRKNAEAIKQELTRPEVQRELKGLH